MTLNGGGGRGKLTPDLNIAPKNFKKDHNTLRSKTSYKKVEGKICIIENN